MQENVVQSTGDTTTFQDDGQRVVNIIRDMVTDYSVNPVDSSDISMFMAKPVEISSGFLDGGPAGTQSLIIPSIGALLSTYTIWKLKLSGYRLCRGTAVFRMNINAQPFQAGRFIMHFLPCFNALDSAYSTIRHANSDLCKITQHPCVEFDIHEASVELRVPYVAPTQWYEFNRGSAISDFSYDWGALFVHVLAQIRVGTGTNDVSYSLYLHFEDFEVCSPIVPQMNADKKNLKARKIERKNVANTGVVSSTLEALISPLDYFRKIPLVGGFVDMGQDLLAGTAGIFSAFGYSRPMDPSNPQMMQLKPYYKSYNYNGIDASDNLCVDSLGAVSSVPGFAGSSKDEMSLSYLKRIPAYVDQVSWLASQASQTKLMSVTVSPNACVLRRTLSYDVYNIGVASAPPFVYLSRYFKFYRGSIEITFKFVKTQYHTGRLAFCFTPFQKVSDFVPISYSDNGYVMREIVDIHQSSEITLIIPMISAKPYLSTGWDPADSLPEALGVLDVWVVNELVAPETVADNITILQYCSAGEDFEFVAPTAVKNYAIPQMGESDINRDRALTTKVIGGYSMPDMSLGPVMACVGDPILSIKQLIMQARPLLNGPTFTSTTVNGITVSSRNFNPFAFCLADTPIVGATANNQLQIYGNGVDVMSELAAGFIFYRGGLRIFDPTAVSTNSCNYLESRSTEITNNIPTIDYFQTTFATPFVYNPNAPGRSNLATQLMVSRGATWGMTEVTVPYYRQTPLALVRSGNGFGPLANSTKEWPDIYQYSLTTKMTATAIAAFYDVYRAGADDFVLGYFIGFPSFVYASV